MKVRTITLLTMIWAAPFAANAMTGAEAEDVRKVSDALSEAAMNLAACDALLTEGTEVSLAQRVDARSNLRAVRDHLTQNFPEIMGAPTFERVAADDGGAVAYIATASPRLDWWSDHWALNPTKAWADLVHLWRSHDAAGKNRVPPPSFTKAHRAIAMEAALRLLAQPIDQSRFITFFALGRLLDGGDGEIIRFANHLLAFRLAYQDGRPHDEEELVRTLLEVRREDDRGLIAVMARQTADVTEDLVQPGRRGLGAIRFPHRA